MGALDGKSALVTGAARGIGAAIARRLAAEGAAVAITYATSQAAAEAVIETIRSAGGRALAIRADAADDVAVTGAVEAAAAMDGGLDILVNNAGVGVPGTVGETPMADFDRVFAVNVRGAFAAMQAAARLMQAGGRIIAIGSINADRIPFSGGAVYAATKAALAGLTRGAARDLGPRGILVNLVQPGPIDTDMNPADGPWAAAARAGIALGHYGETRDVAGLVAFLAGPDAAFITGATFNVDGGYGA